MKIKAKIDRMVNSGNVKAIASVSLDGMFVVKNLKIMDGRKGLFVSMPQETFSGKDGQKKYSNLFFALTNSAKLELQETVLQAYQQQIDPNYTPKQSYEEHGGIECLKHWQEKLLKKCLKKKSTEFSIQKERNLIRESESFLTG